MGFGERAMASCEREELGDGGALFDVEETEKSVAISFGWQVHAAENIINLIFCN